MAKKDSIRVIAAASLQDLHKDSEMSAAFLEQARVRVAKIENFKDRFPQLAPQQSPIYKSCEEMSHQNNCLLGPSPELFATEGTFVLQEQFYGHLSEM